MFIPNPTIYEVEVYAILHGLEMAWEEHINRIYIETDSAFIYEWVAGTEIKNDPLQVAVFKCRELLHKLWDANFVKVGRFANKGADEMWQSWAILTNQDWCCGTLLLSKADRVGS
ncbi:hypothetical protein OROHE_023360 [Orobanche hederae]